MNAKQELLAVVGMGCRFPGGIESISALVEALEGKVNTTCDVPEDRWNSDFHHSSNPASRGKSYMYRGSFLTNDVSQFDPSFFGISPRDAENMDPQQRTMLEIVWEAFENAGLDLPTHAGKDVGVYVGGFMLDHMINQMSPGNRSVINQHTATGMMMTMLSNRISHVFDFRGPSLSIDTACSSSLVAFHYACQELWRGTTKMAVVGGVNIMLRPEYPMGMCKGQFLSRDGECKSFDERADGYGRGEGAGVVLLKPLSDALADGNQVLATVVATGSNQDGHTSGISMPNGEAQRQLIEDVCDRYDINKAAVRYVECHGTGTAIGDPTEATAIGQTYGAARKEQGIDPVVIGSIKSNIGHTEASAGVAGVIKAVLSLMHRKAYPLANLQTPNPKIPFQDLNVKLSDDTLSLGADHDEFLVAVNSFGYGGTNAHAILQTAPVTHPQRPSLTSQSTDASTQAEAQAETRQFPYFLPLSARNPKAIPVLAGQYSALLNDEAIALEDILYSASLKRPHLSHRAVVKGENREELIAALEVLATNEESDDIIQGVEPFKGHRKPVFVFTGMGPQRWNMGHELYLHNPIYRAAVDEADAAFHKVAGFSILDEMLKDEETSQISRTEIAQPANLVIQIGLLAILRAAGIEPGAVVGHSVGELGSAYAAGVLNLEDVMTVSYHRSRLQATCAGTGGMLAIGLGKEQALELIAHCADRVSVAAVNSPSSVTLAGDAAELEKLSASLTEDGTFNRLLTVEVPYHSPMMDPIIQPMIEAMAGIRPQEPQVTLYSTVTGAKVEGVSYDGEYWTRNTRQSVEFATAIFAILEDDYNTFLEIGPHPVLANSMRDCIRASDRDCRTIFTLNRKTPEISTLHRGIASVHASGCEMDWSVHNGNGDWTPLPNYPWQRESLWVENERAAQDRLAPIPTPILGLQEAPATPAWRNDFEHESVKYLKDHVVTGVPILPAAAYIEALLEVLQSQDTEQAALIIRDLKIFAPILLSSERALDGVTTYDPFTKTATIRSLANGFLGDGQIHITSKLAHAKDCVPQTQDLQGLLAAADEQVDVPDFYQRLDRLNLSYGPAFQTIREMRVNDQDRQVLSRIEMDSTLAEALDGYVIHPTVLDACFQTQVSLLKALETTYLPTGFQEMCVYASQLPTKIWCLTELVEQTDRHILCDISLLDDEGQLLAIIRGMRSTAAAKQERVDRFGDPVKRQILTYDWSYGESLTEPKRLGYWLVVGADAVLTQKASSNLEQYGAIQAFPVVLGDSADGALAELGEDVTVAEVATTEDAVRILEQYSSLDGIVFLHGLAATSESKDPTGEGAIAQLIAFSQALLKREQARRPRLYAVTQAAFAVNEHETLVQPSQSAINGFVRVAFNELEGVRFSSIDIPQKLSSEIWDALIMELLCDGRHDEVALRGTFRLVSEMMDSPVLTEDRIQYATLDDEHPIKVRPLENEEDSVGVARMLAATPEPVGAHDIQLRIEATLAPYRLLTEDPDLYKGQPVIEVVAEVAAVGTEVSDLTPGMRVCGYAPVDIASHISGPREQFALVPISAEADASRLVSTLGLGTRAQLAIAALDIRENDTALIYADPLGLVVADILDRQGVKVTLTSEAKDKLEFKVLDRYTVAPFCPEEINAAFEQATAAQGFDLLVVPLTHWTQTFDFRTLSQGGGVIDTDGQASPIALGHYQLARTDLTMYLKRPDRIQTILSKVVDQIEQGQMIPLQNLTVSVHDVAWQKLGLSSDIPAVALTFETQGQNLPVVQQDITTFDTDSTYLITGGFGGFGQKTAEWLVNKGVRHLVLTGRSGANTPERQAFVQTLTDRGVQVKAAACDTSDLQALTGLFNEIQETLPPLKGVFHSGALILDQAIEDIDADTYQKVMRSKALGAWNLHQLTQSLPLDHFVLYSSIANLVGNTRQASYSAANGFLNGLAHMRRIQGLAGTSVNWGAIADVGVVAQDETLEQFLRYTGLRGISSSEGLDLLDVALAREVTQFGVSMISSWADWSRYETRGATSPRFQTLIASDTQDQDDSMRAVLIEELTPLGGEEQVELLGSLLLEIIASVLKADPEGIPLDTPVSQLGIDSLMATELQLQIDAKLGVSISIMELLGDATIRAFARSALASLFEAEAVAA